jgi:hypothetical protein
MTDTKNGGGWKVGVAGGVGIALVFAAQAIAWRLDDGHPLLVGLLVFSPLVMLAILEQSLRSYEASQDSSEAERDRNRRARRRIAIGTAWYVSIIYVSQWLLSMLDDAHPVLIGTIALTPAIGLLLMLRAMVQAHRESDELQRRIDGEAAVIAACVVGFGTFATALVVSAVRSKWPMMPTFHVGPLLIAVWGIAKWRLTKRYA